MMYDSTIVAIATSVMASSIGIIRISGKDALSITEALINKKIQRPRYAYLRKISDNGKEIDQALVLWFKAPFSYTGEDMVEIQCHGGYITLRSVYELLLTHGAVPAQKGEFTKRAFLNGKIDLIQADSINSLINADNSVLAENSIKLMNGIFTDRVRQIREDFLKLLSFIEAYIDFPDDDVEEISEDYLKEHIGGSLKKIRTLIDSYSIYRKYREGIRVAIIGKPNAGKSSLLNALLKEEKAIVSNIPGTTRDVLEHCLLINGMNVTFYDTAGLRENTDDEIEQIGIRRAIDQTRNADIVIAVIDLSDRLNEKEIGFLNNLKEKEVLVVLNKNDLETVEDKTRFEKFQTIGMSLKTGEGFDSLEKRLAELICPDIGHDMDFFVDNIRYVHLLTEAEEIMKKVYQNTGIPLEFITSDIREACRALSEIIGEIYHEDILEKIFSSFCIGK